MWYNKMNICVWVITFCVSFTFTQTQICKKDYRCKISRISGMKAVDCRNKDMGTISQCLPNDVEIIDLSRNRIRKVTKEDLRKYSNLKMLYLDDNMIMTIDEESFEGKDYLQTIDLTLNGLTKIPSVLFHLPSLQVLYLRQNLNINVVDAIEKAKPITSPLLRLDISYIMTEEPDELPDLGLIPTLEQYNISGNKLLSLKPNHFAGLCNLKILDTANMSIQYEEPCDCWTINRWLKNREVVFKHFECSVKAIECLEEVSSDDLEIYTRCRQIYEENIKKSKMKTILWIVIPLFVVIFAIIVFFIVRRRQKQRQKHRDKNNRGQEMKLCNNVSKT
ncbi:platelet glycoprotein Ib alpha chain-like [Tribolium madens]|uniref:platelet glycoprotein Ib alpha chain-like n=1 Tax=Tribolium madens TaxID=41895 RepID=UPI001CF755BB|nr:platelet glycoprotein Ib alpha chain-like [Tribolium madens]XP_044256359.1 platelet glycoprotein Ib alpha chain-like [Tribolium madens]